MKTLLSNQTLWDIDPGPDCPAAARMVVEIGKNSSNKYEYDPHLRLFRLDRSLYSPMHFPGDYGFIPGTTADDEEPIDVLAFGRTGELSGLPDSRPPDRDVRHAGGINV
jgi:inorganic pyrophosphatase